ncbi:MAG: HAMP domain-containing histidine kinase [Lachnospiraceae bacterium]|nr:HAMP domain-containing histidine kinase [Lachnospiraceae bacterium]
MSKKNHKRAVVRTCVIIELVMLAIVALLSYALYRTRRSAVHTEIEKYTAELRASVNGREVSSGVFRDIASYLDELDLWRWGLVRDPDFRDSFAVAMYSEDGGARIFLNGNVAVMYNRVCLDVSALNYRSTVWDLTRYMQEDGLRELFECVNPKVLAEIEFGPTVNGFRGRIDGNGLVTLTEVSLFVPADSRNGREDNKTLILRAADFREDDNYVWNWPKETPGEYSEIGSDGERITRVDDETWLISFVQNEKLCAMIDDWGSLGKDARYEDAMIEFGSEKPCGFLPSGDSENDRLAVSERALVSRYADSAKGTFFVLFDGGAIAWKRTKRPVIVLFAFGQALAIMTAVLWLANRRRSGEVRRLRNTFINAMAHELKTPVAVMNSTAEYLATGCKPEKQAHYLEVLSRESGNVNELLNRMLTYTRVIDEKVTLHRENVDLKEITERTLATYADTIAARGMTVRYSGGSCVISCDAALMEMVIDNLVSNAVRYGDEGSTIVIGTEDERFSVWNRTEPFSRRELRELWEPMFQTDRRSEQSQTGGMGLAICAGILRAHDARFGAYNDSEEVGQDGVAGSQQGIRFFFDFGRAGKAEKERRISSALTLFATALNLALAAGYGITYISNEGRGGTMNLVLMLLWLTVAVCNTLSGAAAMLGQGPSWKHGK